LFGSMGDPKRSVLEERPSRIVRDRPSADIMVAVC